MNFENTLEAVAELPQEQQKTLLNIVSRRLIESRRDEIAENAINAVNDFNSGKLIAYDIDEALEILHNSLIEDVDD